MTLYCLYLYAAQVVLVYEGIANEFASIMIGVYFLKGIVNVLIY